MEIDDDVDRLYAVFSQSNRNLGTPVMPRRWFRSLVEEFPGETEILTVLKDRRPLSSVLSFRFRDAIMPYYGGGTREARAAGANDLMYWSVMCRAADAGLAWFDFGRSKTGSGAFAFKKNWGFEPEPLAYSYRLLTLDRLPDNNPNNPRYRRAIAAWKRLPLPVSRFLGPMIARNLG
ncbi:MAG TPA: GNAT family N-acetyltransferase [Arenibaculum sp.]|nr:GNAT family N-acetyltransferase [Arenibaculum sp.]